MNTIFYLLLSFLSGFVEIGSVVLIITSGLPLLYIPLMGLAYQTGALFREPVKFKIWQYCAALTLSVITAFLIQYSIFMLFLTVFLISIGIQGGRGLISKSANVSTFIKRTSRIAGFGCSGLLSYELLTMASIASLITVLFLWKNQPTVPQKKHIKYNLKIGPLGWVMLIHQSHYFTYAYIIPWFYISEFSVEASKAGLWFSIGWLSYIYSRSIFGEKSIIRNFIIGHIIAAVTLGLIYFFSSTSIYIYSILWFLTGIGGGTVYCLNHLKKICLDDISDMDTCENIGHISGTILCFFVLAISDVPAYPFAVASLIALLTCLLFVLLTRATVRAEDSKVIQTGLLSTTVHLNYR